MIVVMKARSKRDNFIFNKITEAEKKPINEKKNPEETLRKFKIEKNVIPYMYPMSVSVD